VALVGYTNVGKSTLMNLITKSDVFAENKLFATLDTTVRKMVIRNLPFLVTDTVGFIRKLPTQLIESFKSTLNEITESDLLLHIVDISHPNYEEHIDSVNEILGQIDSSDKPLILVYNKIDSIDDHSFIELNKSDEKEYISAQKKININQLKEKIFKHVRKIHVKRFPYNKFLYPDID
jgi:GTP-binding protein HflX